MTPSVALDVGRLQGVKIPLWRKRGKHAIDRRTRGTAETPRLARGEPSAVQRQNVLYTILYARVHHNGGNGKKFSQKNY